MAVGDPQDGLRALTVAALVVAFASATQDICVDGIYIATLDSKKQAAFIGVQGVFWNVGRLFGTALIVWAAGSFKEDHGLSATAAWGWALGLAAVVCACTGNALTLSLTRRGVPLVPMLAHCMGYGALALAALAERTKKIHAPSSASPAISCLMRPC